MESPPLHRLLKSLGRVQHHLHTAIVGLAAVEAGAGKPPDLDITWKPTDTVGSAREARRFLLRPTLVFASEELKAYATSVLRFRDETIPSERAERIRRLGHVEPGYLGVAPLLVSHWRNRIIHGAGAGRLTAAEQSLLTNAKGEIAEKFAHLEVERLLKDFEAERPTLKEVTVLLAMSVRFVRLVDASLPEASSGADVRRWLEASDLLDTVLRLERESMTPGNAEPRRRAARFLSTEAPSLTEAYNRYGAV